MFKDYLKRTMMLVIFLSLLILTVVFGIITPTIYSTKQTTENVYQLRQFLEVKNQADLRSHVTKKKITDMKKVSDGFARYVFRAGEELKLITYLEDTATANKLTQTVNNSNIDRVTNNLITISISATGKYRDIMSYIRSIELSDYFINIEQLQMAPLYSRTGEPSDAINLHLTLALYVNK